LITVRPQRELKNYFFRECVSRASELRTYHVVSPRLVIREAQAAVKKCPWAGVIQELRKGTVALMVSVWNDGLSRDDAAPRSSDDV
jgi:hypothetical protein